MVASNVGIQLLLSDFFYKLGEGGNNGNRAVVGCLGSVTRFMDRMDD